MELKPCPRCGKTPEIGYACGEYFISGNVRCGFCATSPLMKASKYGLTEAWNEAVVKDVALYGNCTSTAEALIKTMEETTPPWQSETLGKKLVRLLQEGFNIRMRPFENSMLIDVMRDHVHTCHTVRYDDISTAKMGVDKALCVVMGEVEENYYDYVKEHGIETDNTQPL